VYEKFLRLINKEATIKFLIIVMQYSFSEEKKGG